MDKNVVTCVYCGHEYDEGTPTAKHDALTKHICHCKDHPMRQLGEALCKLMRLPFPPDKKSWDEMRLGIDIMSSHTPDEDVNDALFALEALKVFMTEEQNELLGDNNGR